MKLSQPLKTWYGHDILNDGYLKTNNKYFYFDYQGGKYGYNTSSSRGADTFSPFSAKTVHSTSWTVTENFFNGTKDLTADHTVRYINVPNVDYKRSFDCLFCQNIQSSDTKTYTVSVGDILFAASTAATSQSQSQTITGATTLSNNTTAFNAVTLCRATSTSVSVKQTNYQGYSNQIVVKFKYWNPSSFTTIFNNKAGAATKTHSVAVGDILLVCCTSQSAHNSRIEGVDFYQTYNTGRAHVSLCRATSSTITIWQSDYQGYSNQIVLKLT